MGCSIHVCRWDYAIFVEYSSFIIVNLVNLAGQEVVCGVYFSTICCWLWKISGVIIYPQYDSWACSQPWKNENSTNGTWLCHWEGAPSHCSRSSITTICACNSERDIKVAPSASHGYSALLNKRRSVQRYMSSSLRWMWANHLSRFFHPKEYNTYS